jgi:hypothetical protein
MGDRQGWSNDEPCQLPIGKETIDLSLIDVLFPAVPPEHGTAEISTLAEDTVAKLIARFPGTTHAMVQGEFTLVNELVRRLQQRGIVCVSATTRRDVIEADGDTKSTRFEFVRFREYL